MNRLQDRLQVRRKIEVIIDFNSQDWQLTEQSCTCDLGNLAKYLNATLQTYANCQTPRSVAEGAVRLVRNSYKVPGSDDSSFDSVLNRVLDHIYGTEL